MYWQYVPGVDLPADCLARVSTRFFGDKGMALGSAIDQMADVLAWGANQDPWGLLRF